MTDHAEDRITIKAPLERVTGVVTDFPRYTTWAKGLREANVIAHTEDGKPLDVEFRAAAMGRSTRYVLRYTITDTRLCWELVQGDVMRGMDGCYEFVAIDSSTTEVRYTLSVDLRMPIPGFVKRRAETQIVSNALRELKKFIEDDSAAAS